MSSNLLLSFLSVHDKTVLFCATALERLSAEHCSALYLKRSQNTSFAKFRLRQRPLGHNSSHRNRPARRNLCTAATIPQDVDHLNHTFLLCTNEYDSFFIEQDHDVDFGQCTNFFFPENNQNINLQLPLSPSWSLDSNSHNEGKTFSSIWNFGHHLFTMN